MIYRYFIRSAYHSSVCLSLDTGFWTVTVNVNFHTGSHTQTCNDFLNSLCFLQNSPPNQAWVWFMLPNTNTSPQTTSVSLGNQAISQVLLQSRHLKCLSRPPRVHQSLVSLSAQFPQFSLLHLEMFKVCQQHSLFVLFLQPGTARSDRTDLKNQYWRITIFITSLSLSEWWRRWRRQTSEFHLRVSAGIYLRKLDYIWVYSWEVSV